MNKAKPVRLTVSFNPELYLAIADTAKAFGLSKTAVINMLLMPKLSDLDVLLGTHKSTQNSINRQWQALTEPKQSKAKTLLAAGRKFNHLALIN